MTGSDPGKPTTSNLSAISVGITNAGIFLTAATDGFFPAHDGALLNRSAAIAILPVSLRFFNKLFREGKGYWFGNNRGEL